MSRISRTAAEQALVTLVDHCQCIGYRDSGHFRLDSHPAFSQAVEMVALIKKRDVVRDLINNTPDINDPMFPEHYDQWLQALKKEM